MRIRCGAPPRSTASYSSSASRSPSRRFRSIWCPGDIGRCRPAFRRAFGIDGLTQRFCNLCQTSIFLRLGAIHFYLRLHRRYSACSLLRSTCRRKPLFRRRMCWEGVDALHNNVFGRKIMKDGSQRREPETSVFVLIARRMEPEHPAVRLKGHSAQAPEWPFAISRSVSARRKRAVIEIARSKTRSRGAAYRPCTARLIESPVARTP